MRSTAPPTLAITTLSPVATGSAFCRVAGFLWATVIVKATFELVHGEAARLLPAEELILTDRGSAPVPGQAGSPAHASPIAPGQSLVRARETAPHLPNAGVILTGHACAPNGRAVSSMSVRLGLSRDRPVLDKTLHVFGARAAQNPAAISPFQRMPLVYERAAGGPHSPENPVGVGGPGSPVYPNIVHPKDPRIVAGFGPVSPQWAPRRASVAGTDPAAMEAPILDVPVGFDWRFFQAAPRDQQIDRLHGDEWIVLDGMDPARPRVQSRLPEITARARRRVSEGRGVITEEAVELRADMLVIDADRGVASLVWRGRFAVEPLEALDRTIVLVELEQPGKPVAWPAVTPKEQEIAQVTETKEVNLAAILGPKVPFLPADRDSHLPTAPIAHGPVEAPPRQPVNLTGVVDVQAILKSLLPFAELPDSRSPMSQPTPAAQKAPRMDTATSEVDVSQILRGATPYDREAPSPPAPPREAPVFVTPPAPEAPVFVAPPDKPPPPTPIVETPALIKSPGSTTESATLGPPPQRALSAPSSAAKKASSALGKPPTEAHALRARVIEKLANNEPLDGEDLSFANLSGLDLTGCSLARCDLRGAKLRGTKLGGAVLTRAKLDEADLRGAQLEGANLSEASLVNADLEQANLTKAMFDRADLSDAQLRKADLRGARMREASLIGARMCGARLSTADLRGARLDTADLTDAHLEDVIAGGAVFSGANLDGADLRRADLTGAALHKWSTRRARLAGANLQNTTDTAPDPADGPRPDLPLPFAPGLVER